VRPIASAQIIAVGSELLTPTRIDTNSLYITARLNEVGVAVRRKIVIGDTRDDLLAAFRAAYDQADLVVLSGGLGPTDDDVTRDVIAAALARPLAEDASLVAGLRERFARRHVTMPEINRRQAMVPAGAEVLTNPNGSAPGLWIEDDDHLVVLLPGPPRELRPMIDGLAGRLAACATGQRLVSGVVRIAGHGESHAEERAQPLYERWRREGLPVDATTLASPGSVDFYVTVQAADEAAARAGVARAITDLVQVFGEDAYATCDRGMERVVGDMLRERRWTIAAAESCTGGLLTSRLTDVPGSSAYVERSVVAYSNRAKEELLGVPGELIQTHGAVSEPVAEAMADGIRQRARTDIGVGVTGIAGPDGGTPAKPVGTVCIAVAGPWGVSVRTRLFSGDREMVKVLASQGALDDLRRALMRAHAGTR
jgi:nicotinamide-nucleotide amidase